MLSESKTSRILRELPREKAFYFFTSIGNYTGHNASSLEEFVREILEVNVKSLEFHLYRKDFEKWVSETLEDNSLASKVGNLRAVKPIGIDLRDQLYLIVSKHLDSLKKPKTTTSTEVSKRKTTSVTFGKTFPREPERKLNKGISPS
jgi:hypothetical protein